MDVDKLAGAERDYKPFYPQPVYRHLLFSYIINTVHEHDVRINKLINYVLQTSQHEKQNSPKPFKKRVLTHTCTT